MAQIFCPKCKSKKMVLLNGKFGPYYHCNACQQNTAKAKFAQIEKVQAVKEFTTFVPTSEQSVFYNALLKIASRDFLLVANPGTGKTTTLANIPPSFLQDKKVVYTAFNSKNIEDFSKKSVIFSKTLHGLQFDNIKAVYSAVKRWTVYSDNEILKEYINKFCGLIAEDEKKSFIAPFSNFVALCFANMVYSLDATKALQIIGNYGIELEYSETIPQIFNGYIAYAKSQIWQGRIEFLFMLSLPIIDNMQVKKFDVILCDESQDFSKEKCEIISRMRSNNGQIIFAGDSLQAIYAWAGANPTSIDEIKNRFNPVIFELTLTHRFSQDFCNLLNESFGTRMSSTNQEAGLIEYTTYGNITKLAIDKFENSGITVLCPFNSPMIKPAFELLRQGYPVKILGKEIGGDLIEYSMFINKKYNCENLKDFQNAISSHFNKQYEKYSTGFTNKGWLATLQDKTETILQFSYSCESVNEILEKITMLFSDDITASKITFSSIHKAKGREWDNVIVYGLDAIGAKAETDVQKIESRNVKFVALSRMKKELYVIRDIEKISE